MPSPSIASAHAKFILLGEHFVIEGTPAIVFPIPQLQTTIEISPAPIFNVTFEGGTDFEMNRLKEATLLLCREIGISIQDKPFQLTTRSDIPFSRGLGSSASLSVALTRALLDYHGDQNSRPQFELTQLIETLFHRTPSGVDVAGAESSCPIFFESPQKARALRNSLADFILIDSGPRKNSLEMISNIQQLKISEPALWNVLRDKMTHAVNEADQAFQNGQLTSLTQAIQSANEIQTKLGLNTPAIDQILNSGIQQGALAGKATGAGGGGALFLMTEKGQGTSFASQMTQSGFQVLAVVS